MMFKPKGIRGFTLVEVLVTMIIMGLVITSVYSLFLNSQRSSITSEEVVDVQQNLRIAYDMMARDIRMAGFAHPGGLSGATASEITIQSASPFGRYARIIRVDDNVGAEVDPAVGIPSTSVTEYSFIIPFEHAKSLRQGHVFRICRPQDGTYVPTNANDGTYFIATSDPARNAADEYYINLELLAPGGADTINFAIEPNGDLLARVMVDDVGTPTVLYYPYDNDPAVDPFAIVYSLVDDPSSADPNQKRLMRVVTNGSDTLESQVLATKILDVQFNYILLNNTVVPAPVANLGDVVGIQIHLTGATDATQTGKANYSGVKTREIFGRVHMKNRSITSGT